MPLKLFLELKGMVHILIHCLLVLRKECFAALRLIFVNENASVSKQNIGNLIALAVLSFASLIFSAYEWSQCEDLTSERCVGYNQMSNVV